MVGGGSRGRSDGVCVPFPRHFVPRRASAAGGGVVSGRGSGGGGKKIVHLVDHFYLGGPRPGLREWLVGIDSGGALELLPWDHRDLLPPAVQTELSYHELSGAGTL